MCILWYHQSCLAGNCGNYVILHFFASVTFIFEQKTGVGKIFRFFLKTVRGGGGRQPAVKRQAQWPGLPPPQVRGLIAHLRDLEDDGSAVRVVKVPKVLSD